MDTYELCGKKYPVKGHVRITDDRGRPTGGDNPYCRHPADERLSVAA